MEPRGSDARDRIDAMSPPGYPWAGLLSSRVGFRFTRRDQFNAAVEASPARSDSGTNASWGEMGGKRCQVPFSI